MLRHKGPGPGQAVIGSVMFSFNADGKVVDAKDATTFSEATKQQIETATAAASAHPKFWEVVPGASKADEPEDERADDQDDDESDEKPRRGRRRKDAPEE